MISELDMGMCRHLHMGQLRARMLLRAADAQLGAGDGMLEGTTAHTAVALTLGGGIFDVLSK